MGKRFNIYYLPQIGISFGYCEGQLLIHLPFMILIINTLKQSDYDSSNQW